METFNTYAIAHEQFDGRHILLFVILHLLEELDLLFTREKVDAVIREHADRVCQLVS